MIDDVLLGYAASAAELIARYESISAEQLYAPVADLLPQPPSRIADIGAGTGRDAAWLADKGHHVVAIEPVAEFRRAGMLLHASPSLEWLDDRLPELRGLRALKTGIDCMLLSAVWQHLDDQQRRAALHTIAILTAPGARVIMSLRHGAGAPGRIIIEAPPERTIADAASAGFELMRRRETQSAQPINRQSGVHWTWLVFQHR
ncbi:MAG: class I SAM-dependent methyltransferase [Alphaproteobacteria bacterium]|nr:class I SAM-dependent methyltransferase [Alphaproteobacteria bacterium]